ncbi:MAG: NADH-quinone oxidoreductase subunit N [Armatimonadetes bacterium]|nr:NADH-quinone oxidoreductase subunit N [Armatimonadota bacterium]
MNVWQTLWEKMAPELWLALMGFAIFTLDLIFPRSPKRNYGILTIVAFVGALLLVGWQMGKLADAEMEPTNKIAVWLTTAFVADRMAVFFKVAILVGALLVAFVTVDYAERHIWSGRAEFYAILVFAVLALCFMASAVELITLFLAIEFASIASYILAAYMRDDPKSSEAGLKYFLVGATTTAVALYGMSLIYGTMGTTQLYEIAEKLTPILGEKGSAFGLHPFTLLGLLLMLAMLGFKVSMVPVHGWAPDAYEGAPTPVTAFLSVASKAAGMAAFLRIVAATFGPASTGWQLILAFLSLVTMTFGNLGALWQRNIKRLMAYSSIAQVGYLLIGIAAFTPTDWQILTGVRSAQPTDMGLPGVLYFVLGYAFANMAAFAVIVWVENFAGSSEMEDYDGLAQKSPLAASLLTISFLSLIGIPPLAGFFGKFFLFGAAIKAGLAWLAIAGIINSVISAAYYLEVVRRMFFLQPKIQKSAEAPFLVSIAAIVGVLGAFLLGIFVGPAFQWAQDSLYEIVTLTVK